MTAPLHLIDVGARGGAPDDWWLAFAVGGSCTAIEPDSQSAALLRAGGPYSRVVETAAFDSSTERSLHLAANAACSSLKDARTDLVALFPARRWFTVQSEIPLKTQRLDSALEFDDERSFIWLKIDTQGCEYEVLRGLGDYLDRVLMVDLEQQFTQFYNHDPFEAATCLLEAQFVPVEFSFNRWFWGGFSPEGDVLWIRNPDHLDREALMALTLLLASRGQRRIAMYLACRWLDPEFSMQLQQAMGVRSRWGLALDFDIPGRAVTG